jgi:predicted metalloprotease with PDZ domain
MSKADRVKALHDDAYPDSDKLEKNEIGKDGKPTTGVDGQKLTPADMFAPGDVITVTVGKSNPKQDPGLKVEEKNGKYYVRKVPSGGLFAKTPVFAGDKILEVGTSVSSARKWVDRLISGVP